MKLSVLIASIVKVSRKNRVILLVFLTKFEKVIVFCPATTSVSVTDPYYRCTDLTKTNRKMHQKS